MANKAKQKGTSFETEILRYLRDAGFLSAHRTATKGGLDTGDINGLVQAGAHPNQVRQAVVQCKNQRAFDLSGWLNSTVEQASQVEVGGNALPILVAKRPRVGASNSGNHYAILRLEDLIILLKDAGYR